MNGRLPAQPDRPVVVSMLSAAYSGATLFAILLDQHSRITCNGETFPVERGDRVECSCGRRQIDCEYYRAVAGHMLEEEGQGWDDDLFAQVPRYTRLRPLDRALGGFWLHDAGNLLRERARAAVSRWRRRDAAFVEAHRRFFANSLRSNGTEVYVDGSKAPHRAEILAASRAFDLKAIHLVRDGRAFSYSYIKNQKLPRSDLTTAAGYWNRHLAKIDSFHSRFPEVPLLHVRYEDLCTDLPGTLGRVCRFLGVSPEERTTPPDPASYHVTGNRMRKSFDGTVRLDSKWERELDSAEIESLTSEMHDGLDRFGYLGPPPRQLLPVNAEALGS
jgi:hypothetical protein